jgi:hypothetical protein
MLSMGEDLKDERKKGHMEFKDHLHHKMLIILFPYQAEDHVWFEDRWMVASLSDE